MAYDRGVVEHIWKGLEAVWARALINFTRISMGRDVITLAHRLHVTMESCN